MSRAQTLVCHMSAKCAFPMRFEPCTYILIVGRKPSFSTNLRDGRPCDRFLNLRDCGIGGVHIECNIPMGLDQCHKGFPLLGLSASTFAGLVL
jgi:hypothetical protein